MVRPSETIKLVKELARFWHLGVYIGDPAQLFGTFKLIRNEGIRNETKQVFMTLYKSMKDAHPKLVEVDWS